MRQPVGIDLNGWADAACRDWSVEDEPDAAPGVPQLVDGGLCAVVVEHETLHVGGPQAILSQIGRGAGWGPIGATEKRRQVAALWHGLLAAAPAPNFAGDLRAAVAALSHAADHRMLCIPDRREMDEERQRMLLQALQGPRQPTVHLLWRTVAMVLGLLDDPRLATAADGSRIACLVHESDGFVLQTFTLRALREHGGILAPVRGDAGALHGGSWGLAALLVRATAAVAAANPGLADWGAERPRMPAALLFAPSWPRAAEIVRRDTGTWARVVPPPSVSIPDPAELALPAIDADILLLCTPLAAQHRAGLEAALHAATGLAVVPAGPGDAARGALYATRRIARGVPHYLDRLDPVALVVNRRGEPVFEDLIGPDAVVPGNREYVSAPIGHLVWSAGMERAEFYIRKGATQIRRWVVDSLHPPARAQALIVQLRQTPAQGWARMSITSSDWEALRNSPIVLDWNRLEAVDETADEVLAKLARPRPVVPDRLRLRPHIGLWDGSLRSPGVRKALRGFHAQGLTDLHELSNSLRTAHRDQTSGRGPPFFPVGSDGDLPTEVDPVTVGQFDAALELAQRQLMLALEGRRLVDNGALLVLTWTFARCPAAVKQALFVAVSAVAAGTSHPFLEPRAARSVVVQGLGRVLVEEELLRQAIPMMATRLENANFLSALAAMVSRPECTSVVLAGLNVETIVSGLRRRIVECNRNRNFGVHFKYALTAAAGLLRVREVEPWALVTDRSPAAADLRDELNRAAATIEIGRSRVRNADALLPAMRDIVMQLEGTGGSANILTTLENIEETTE
jgi:hypothetical protein